MAKGKAFFVVGHERWGKSRTLRELKGGLATGPRRVAIIGKEYFIRNMSNDDKANSYLSFVNRINIKNKPLLIAALCPNFHKPDRYTEQILHILYSKYKLAFWVIKHKYRKNEEVSSDEIKELNRFGKVIVYKEKKEADERAKQFRLFIAEQM